MSLGSIRFCPSIGKYCLLKSTPCWLAGLAVVISSLFGPAAFQAQQVVTKAIPACEFDSTVIEVAEAVKGCVSALIISSLSGAKLDLIRCHFGAFHSGFVGALNR